VKPQLLHILACPHCGGPFEARVFAEAQGAVEEGLLWCPCGATYPVVGAIPRLLDNAWALFPSFGDKYRAELAALGVGHQLKKEGHYPAAVERSRRSFGYQWSVFGEMSCDFRDNFLNYIHPLAPPFFEGKLGLDAGCGFGRHIYHAAQFGAEMVGLDISAAIDVARQHTKNLPNVHLLQADIHRPPFRPQTFDFVYSIGVLHHLPDPRQGFWALRPLLKPGGAIFIWVYSKERRRVIQALELVRRATTRLPYGLLRRLCFLAAAVDWLFFILPYKAARRLPATQGWVEKAAFPRVKLYSQYPFQVVYADWFDRLSAPIRWYYEAPELRAWFEGAGLSLVRITPTGRYGWRAYGENLL